MDEFSNEFMRLENYIEKYIPLRVQNIISETMDRVLGAKDKKRMREYEEKKFLQLRNIIIEDTGLPNLYEDCRAILNTAGKYHEKFIKFE
jgi:hypothetical protein